MLFWPIQLNMGGSWQGSCGGGWGSDNFKPVEDNFWKDMDHMLEFPSSLMAKQTETLFWYLEHTSSSTPTNEILVWQPLIPLPWNILFSLPSWLPNHNTTISSNSFSKWEIIARVQDVPKIATCTRKSHSLSVNKYWLKVINKVTAPAQIANLKGD